MQIKRMELKNWKGFDDFSFEPARINVLTGNNGCGKTSVIESVKTLLNGKTPEAPVRSGCDDGSITGEILDIGTITRRWDIAAGKVVTRLNGKNTTQKSVLEMLNDIYGIDSQTTEMMSSSEVMRKMFGPDFAEYVLSFIKNDMDINRLVDLCKPSEEAEKALREYFPPTPEIISLEDIDAAYTYFKGEQTDITRNINGNKVIAESFPYDAPTMTKEEARCEIDKVSRAFGALDGRKKAHDQALKAREKNLAQIKDLEDKLAKMTRTPPTKEAMELLSSQLKDASENIARLNRQIASNQNVIESTKKILKNLDSSVCPISKKLVCTTDKSDLRSELQETIKTISSEIVELQDVLKGYEEAKEKYEECSKEYLLAAQEAKYRESYQTLLDNAKKVDITIPDAPEEKEYEELEKEMNRLKTMYSVIEKYELAVEASKNVIKLKARREVIKEVVDLLTPKTGVRKKVLLHNIEPLQEYCDELSKSIMPKYRLILDCEKGLDVVLKDKDGNTIPFKAASNGEKIKATYIITDMLNALNGFRILIIDDLDGLDEIGMTQLMDIISKNAKMYDHIFLASVKTTEAMNAFAHLPKELTKMIEF